MLFFFSTPPTRTRGRRRRNLRGSACIPPGCASRRPRRGVRARSASPARPPRPRTASQPRRSVFAGDTTRQGCCARRRRADHLRRSPRWPRGARAAGTRPRSRGRRGRTGHARRLCTRATARWTCSRRSWGTPPRRARPDRRGRAGWMPTRARRRHPTRRRGSDARRTRQLPPPRTRGAGRTPARATSGRGRLAGTARALEWRRLATDHPEAWTRAFVRSDVDSTSECFGKKLVISCGKLFRRCFVARFGHAPRT
mmetsp:Transcript_14280/g.60158  ORF Transcript_14280/g.60158 Transcript_14280/m.60158 type:complete len:255 (-) Transcript_14280:232-996(-)